MTLLKAIRKFSKLDSDFKVIIIRTFWVKRGERIDCPVSFRKQRQRKSERVDSVNVWR